MSEATYILVHGGWSGAWSWRDVGKELTRREIPWTALDLPSSTHGAHPNTYLADDAREVIEVAKLDGPVVLVGHSYGGAVITEAADQIPNLERLVYIAALVPALGQSASEAKSEVEIMTRLDEAIERSWRLPRPESGARPHRALSGLQGEGCRMGRFPTHPSDGRQLSQPKELLRR